MKVSPTWAIVYRGALGPETKVHSINNKYLFNNTLNTLKKWFNGGDQSQTNCSTTSGLYG